MTDNNQNLPIVHFGECFTGHWYQGSLHVYKLLSAADNSGPYYCRVGIFPSIRAAYEALVTVDNEDRS